MSFSHELVTKPVRQVTGTKRNRALISHLLKKNNDEPSVQTIRSNDDNQDDKNVYKTKINVIMVS